MNVKIDYVHFRNGVPRISKLEFVDVYAFKYGTGECSITFNDDKGIRRVKNLKRHLVQYISIEGTL